MLTDTHENPQPWKLPVLHRANAHLFSLWTDLLALLNTLLRYDRLTSHFASFDFPIFFYAFTSYALSLTVRQSKPSEPCWWLACLIAQADSSTSALSSCPINTVRARSCTKSATARQHLLRRCELLGIDKVAERAGRSAAGLILLTELQPGDLGWLKGLLLGPPCRLPGITR